VIGKAKAHRGDAETRRKPGHRKKPERLTADGRG
jgi:hypothetical protein